jgi:uncharacterized protein YdhG (YjbR/CyaY superfamily)
MTDKPTSAKRTSTTDKTAKVFSEGERAAIQDRAKELKSETGRGPEAKRAADLADVLTKIAEMPAADRDLAQLVHQIITTNVPELSPKTWYGMPSYAKDGKIVCFFQGAYKFNTRYAMLGFNDSANLDDGNVWPVYWALTKLTAADQATVAALVRRAVS